MWRLSRPVLVFWLFIRILVYIMAFILIVEIHDLAQVLINSFEPVVIPISWKINVINLSGWDRAFLSPLIIGIFAVLVLSIFFLIPMSLVRSPNYRLKSIELYFLFPSFRFFDTRVFHRSLLNVNFFIFCGLLAAGNILIYFFNY